MRALLLLAAVALAGDGSNVKAKYLDLLTALATRDQALFNASVDEHANFDITGWGNPGACGPSVQRDAVWASYIQQFNTSRLNPVKVMAADGLLLAHVEFAGFMNPANAQSDIVIENNVFHLATTAGSPAGKITAFREISAFAPTADDTKFLTTVAALNSAWTTGNSDGYKAHWDPSLKFEFNYVGATKDPYVVNFTDFEAYAPVLPLSGPSRQGLLGQAAACGVLAVRVWIVQGKLNLHGPPAIQDSIIFAQTKPGHQGKWVYAFQLLDAPPQPGGPRGRGIFPMP